MAKLFLVDGSNHAFRVHFALPPMQNAAGFPTRALYGFTTLFAKLVRVHQPDYCAVSFDRGETFRHALYAEYKGHRPEMPEDLAQQWPHFPALVEAFGFRCVMVDGFEADDVIGTLARRFSGADLDVYLVTGDRDFYQLVDDHVRVLDLMKEEEIGPSGVLERFGVRPDQVIEVKGLAGDTSDNIPGVPGIGEKTAVKYIQQYGSVESVLAAAEKIGGKRGQALKDFADQALLSRRLATIDTACPIGVMDLEELRPRGLQEGTVREMFDRWDFGKVARKLLPETEGANEVRTEIAKEAPEVAALAEKLRAKHPFALEVHVAPDGETVSGLSFAAEEGTVTYVPVDRRDGSQAILQVLRPILEDSSIGKIGHDTKAAKKHLARLGVHLAGISGDTELLDYVLAAHERSHSLGELSQRYLGRTLVGVGSGAELPFARPIEETARYAAEGAHVAWQLERKLRGRLEPGSRRIYEEIELPLVPVLADMEAAGIRVALDRLGAIREDIGARLGEAERRCHSLAGRTFNVNSRHEVADVLFCEGSPFVPTKKVKDGWSTDSSVLEKLVDGTNLPTAILEYRQLQKLMGTYLDKLPTYVRADGRIHTTFNQAVAATGRLSSTDPNLQNIPVRTWEGRRIRDCFVPEPGHVFLSADYSQIELRILAHMTGEEALVRAFQGGEDIHRRTASEVFGVPLEQVSFELRNAAKAINFGLLYGMSSFRLAGDLQISREEATKYMDVYFGRLPRVGAWIEETRQDARKKGWVETLYGRRRVLPAIHSQNYAERNAADREAVNSRVQGTAADVIKLAMLAVSRMLREEGFQARMLLQVHDELLFEVPKGEIEALTPRVVQAMEKAAELLVPLHVNTAVGTTWNEAHG